MCKCYKYYLYCLGKEEVICRAHQFYCGWLTDFVCDAFLIKLTSSTVLEKLSRNAFQAYRKRVLILYGTLESLHWMHRHVQIPPNGLTYKHTCKHHVARNFQTNVPYWGFKNSTLVPYSVKLYDNSARKMFMSPLQPESPQRPYFDRTPQYWWIFHAVQPQ